MKKAQSLSINTLIVAALALLALIVIVFIFVNYIRGYTRGTASCKDTYGGECRSQGCDAGMITISGQEWSDCLAGQSCCKKIAGN